MRGWALWAARVGVTASMAFLALGLYAAVSGNYCVHMALMAYGVLLLFPYSVGVAYIVSGGGRGVSAAGVPLLLAAALLAPLGRVGAAAFASVLAGAAGLVDAAEAARGRRGSVGLSLGLSAAAMAGMAVEQAMAALLPRAGGCLGVIDGLSAALGFPVPLVYAVTVHSLPSTFGDRGRAAPAAAAVLLAVASSMLVLVRLHAGIVLALVSTILYLYGAGFDRLGRYLSRARSVRGAAGRGLLYFAWGHVAAAASAAMLLACGLAALASAAGLYWLLHCYTLGFLSIHVWIHGPMMLPVLLRLRHRRRYTLLPYVSTLPSAALFPVAREPALLLYVAALASTVLIVI